MGFSYSFHLSAKAHAVTTTHKVSQISKHNLRRYEKNNKGDIDILRGSDKSILADVRAAYERLFNEALKNYNSKQKIPSRRIDDYLEHMSESRADVACEIIIQIGDSEFWSTKSKTDWKKMTPIFLEQLNTLETAVPAFEVVSAVVHYDESSPHMHIVGIPVADGYVKGMSRQVAKTKVFTRDVLENLQDIMRKSAEASMNKLSDLFEEMKLEKKRKGRNRDIPKYRLDDYYEAERKIEQAQMQAQEQQAKLDEMETVEEKLEKIEQKKAFQVVCEKWLEVCAEAKETLTERHKKVIEKLMQEKKPLGELGRKHLEHDYIKEELRVPKHDGTMEILFERPPRLNKKQKKVDRLIRIDTLFEAVTKNNSLGVSLDEVRKLLEQENKKTNKKKKCYDHSYDDR